MLKGKELQRSRMHAMAFKRVCNYVPNNFPLAVMLWGLTFFIILAKLDHPGYNSETWERLSKNTSFEHQTIHAYLDASTEGDTVSLYRNFSFDFTKYISTDLKRLCKDCKLIFQSKQSFKDSMPYTFNKMISNQFLISEEEQDYNYVSFSYERPILSSESLKMADPRVLEKITNKQTKQLTVYFTMQTPHLSHRALNLAHNLVFM